MLLAHHICVYLAVTAWLSACAPATCCKQILEGLHGCTPVNACRAWEAFSPDERVEDSFRAAVDADAGGYLVQRGAIQQHAKGHNDRVARRQVCALPHLCNQKVLVMMRVKQSKQCVVGFCASFSLATAVLGEGAGRQITPSFAAGVQACRSLRQRQVQLRRLGTHRRVAVGGAVCQGGEVGGAHQAQLTALPWAVRTCTRGT